MVLNDRVRLSDRCAELVAAQHKAGRLALTASQRREFAALHRTALADPGGSEGEVLWLLTRSFDADDEIPEYYRYTDLHVYGWFLEAYPKDRLHGVLLSLHATVTRLLDIERAGGVAGEEREARLLALIDTIGDLPVDENGLVRGAEVVATATQDPEARRRMFLLVECSGFPMSDDHHEHIFLRAVHACEVAFFAVRWIACQAMTAVEREPLGAVRWVELLGRYAQLINQIFHALRTLTPEMFLTFRDATGAASAVQSLNYHLMELVLYGYDSRKAEVYERFPHLARLLSTESREQRCLREAVRDSGLRRLQETYARTDATLLTWRGRHYGFGRRHLADIKGSGGTEGAGYLKRFVHKDGPGVAGGPTPPAGTMLDFVYR
ncbi:tryptophan 2,3-dioxygenase family protein [Micromonospora sp. WMMD1120]|uniref:tryptophan 2,3-dioxygenase family protein n=1 Tax=Micromonospora sp. WMMD1120 TaxID=3016106 RepID=UPI002417EBB9|nr:tryptophan 2,3-dioxygenase family protein [Micromonospora sp. WMMD1120]MDG4810800.1 tryptophan 2,3-dioxygenase family protein [Micromonospora sp. WMMD1120]